MNRAFYSIGSVGLAIIFAACSSGSGSDGTGGGGNTPGTGGTGTGGSATGGTSGAAGAKGGTGGTGTGGSATGGSGGTGTGGTGGGATGGAGGSGAMSGAGGTGTGGSAGMPATGGAGPSTGGATATGGGAGVGGTAAGGMSGSAGMAGSGGTPVDLPPVVTSSASGYWMTGTLTDSTATATVTVNDTTPLQTWDGFGGAFNELGWNVLTTKDMQDAAIKLLFSASDGANFAWGRIPIGASDYAISRYTLVDTTDPTPNGETARPAAGTFSLDRDGQKLIPYIKAAQAVKSDLRFWASPWTPPLAMKTGFKANSGADSSQNAKKPSYYDGGNMKSDATTLTAYAAYYTQFVQGYGGKGINIELVSPQNEPGYDQNYPSCLWDKTTYTTWIGQYLGPAMKTLNVKVMLGTLSNESAGKDADNAAAALADPTAKSFLSVIGAQWGMLNQSKLSPLNSTLPVWATEHKCGNYPWMTSSYNATQAPNDMAYGVETWGYIRDAITKVKVTSYNAWNMVLDKSGLGIDTTRDWKQDALLVADGGMVKPTPAYYVFRHMSQYVQPTAHVVGTTGGDAVAWKNPDGSVVAVMYNSGAANAAYVVAVGSKKVQFSMPAAGWATVLVKP